ncbi:hypothetical protein M949_1047 [Riemerella anatipestifer CH3]|nr:hypothetical protein M949_1047 [Riemerella anatipestifer CH3]SNV63814.1 Uncharacterised protein [Riemerella anatipestifer]
MNALWLQYIIILLVFLMASYSLFKVVKKSVSPTKFKSKRTHCDKDCSCS